MQVAQTKVLRPVDDNRIGIGDVYTALDDGGGESLVGGVILVEHALLHAVEVKGTAVVRRVHVMVALLAVMSVTSIVMVSSASGAARW